MTQGLEALAARQQAWLSAATEDAQLASFRRNVDLRLALVDRNHHIAVAVTPGGISRAGTDVVDVSLVAPSEAWSELLSHAPAPTMNHFLAMRMRVEGTRIEGDEMVFAQHAHVVRRLLELAREIVDGPVLRAPDPVLDRSGIRGRHVEVTVDGHQVDLYVEEVGSGDASPLLVLHTAGADGRQAHPLMADAELTARRRVITFDMPGHGRSEALPGPLGSWTLTADRYADSILGIIEALALEKPVLVGASMAGEACLLMAYRSPDRLGGVIACEASEHVPGRVTPWAGHPRVNESVFVPEWIDGLIAPTAPASMRDLIWLGYSQGGHRTFAGDIDFYSGAWDGRDIVPRIDTSLCPVVMMTGEYDYSCTPAMSKATAERIPGARFWTMTGLGHFPICEHPAAFRPHLDKALAEIGA
ncbi:alpha/beta fold hydrolase [Arthrobacter sp. M4]|uniref:alpha/beta fold hydrolase n=1 Tax=Arthrobacter sp. M4 TaxID=218160 RepID=UPI001CDD822F|nr:alpha/beta hydrolase [Arthrobacter sp. M4]MCA4135375.1 alpha/beta hydrolase [Arthrobacter sp. M4]